MRLTISPPLALPLNYFWWLLVAVGMAFAAPPAHAQDVEKEYCLDPTFADTLRVSDLYCTTLVPVPALRGASGYVELVPVSSPFGASVTAAGIHRYTPVVHIDGLPEPAALGPYSLYKAWLTTPEFAEPVLLGVVRNGTTMLAEIALNKFVLLISAEADAEGTTRSGRLVLRGWSPSLRMEPHDLATTAPLALYRPVGASDGHTHHRDLGDDSGWRMPPANPLLTMPPGEMALRPKVSPFRPSPPPYPTPALPPARVHLADGDAYGLDTRPALRRLGDSETVAYTFNGRLPGPMFDVDQGSTVRIAFTNFIPLPTAVHWHGLRLDYRSDGVPGFTQPLLQTGDTFDYELRFPDAGMFWYHPHHREDIGMDLGLYGNILVRPSDPTYYSPVNEEFYWLIDDLLLQDGEIVPYGAESANYMLMGRLGNVHIINGEPQPTVTVNRGAVARFFLTNASNARVYNLSFGGLPIKVVAADAGRLERETMVESVVIAPSERYTVEVRFPESGRIGVLNAVQAIDHLRGSFFAEVDTVAWIDVAPAAAAPDHRAVFDRLHAPAAVGAEFDALRPQFGRPVDRELAIRLRTTGLPPVVEQLMRFDGAYVNPVEWSDTMPMMNWASTGAEIQWILEDVRTGKQNMAIDWRFKRGDVVKIRIRNERNPFHTMHHPIHFHGQRFLVLSHDGIPNEHLAWKDTMLLPAGVTADLLLEISNPGVWMAHCHIAEHIASGMMFVFHVD